MCVGERERESVCVCIRAIGQFKATSLHANGKKKKKEEEEEKKIIVNNAF
jgi:hypothetical protein